MPDGRYLRGIDRLIARTRRARQIEVQHLRASGILEAVDQTEERINDQERGAQPRVFDAREVR